MDYKQLYDSVVAGNAPALQSYIEVKKYAEDLATYVEALKDLAAQEHQALWGGKEVVIDGATVSRHSGGRYVYDGVPGWKETKDKLTLIEKSAQLAYKAGGSVVDEESGEIIPPAKYVPNKESITIRLPKE
jgi:hypothetical protein